MTDLQRSYGAKPSTRKDVMLLGSLIVLVLQASPATVPSGIWKEIDPSQVCSTTLSWRTGIQSDFPEDLEERVARILEAGRPVWRVTHAPRDTATAAAAAAAPGAHDVYDLDAATLRPLESEHRMNEGRQQRLTRFVYEIESDRVRKLNHRGETVERIDLEGRLPLPEGPGSAAIYQAIRWRDGLRVRAFVVDRWRGSGTERLHSVEIRVVGRDAVRLQQRSVSTFVVSVQPDNHAYRILHHVTVERPHHIVRTEYIVRSRPAFISEVVAIAPARIVRIQRASAPSATSRGHDRARPRGRAVARGTIRHAPAGHDESSRHSRTPSHSRRGDRHWHDGHLKGVFHGWPSANGSLSNSK